jgi:cytoskeletal protein RodZ
MAVFGDTLRQARAHKGVTLKEAEQATRINRHHLLALEEEQFDDLPPLIYQRGIVRNYATYLKLDPNKLLTMFDGARGNTADDPPPVITQQRPDLPTHWAPNFAVIAFLVVMSAVVFAWMYSAYFAPSDPTVTPTELIPTVTAVKNDPIFLPTATPSPTVSPTATAEPTQEPTPEEEAVVDEESSSAGSGDVQDVQTEEPTEEVDEVVVEEPTQEPEPTAEMDGALTFNFQAATDVEAVTIVADGSEVFSGYLPAGESTGFMSADHFQVYVSDPSALEIVRENGESFFMGDSYFELP